jgi:hypothetical protein
LEKLAASIFRVQEIHLVVGGGGGGGVGFFFLHPCPSRQIMGQCLELDQYHCINNM